MRKQNQIFFFVFLLTTLFHSPILFANPYQVPNAQFEEWGGSYSGQPQPAVWNFSNVEQVGMQFAIGKRSTDAHSGSYSVHLQDTPVGAMGIVEDSPSWITLGTPWTYLDGIKVNSASAGTDGGIAFSARPDTMSVWVKRHSNDSQPITLLFYSWNGQSTGNSYLNKGGGCSSTTHIDEESDIRIATDPNSCGTATRANQVAEGQLRTSKKYGSWTELKVPIKYYNNEIPQKMNIILSSCSYPNGRATGGLNTSNYVLMDDVKLIYSSVIHEIRFNGEPYAFFRPNKTNYVVELGENATDADIPTITCKRSGRDLSGSEISVQYAQHLGESTIITVRAEDGSSTTVYTLTFNRKLSKNANPNQILVNGEPIQGFSGYVKDYDVELPYGTTEVPSIVVDKAEPAQTYKVETCGKVPCNAKVTVFAENTEYFNVYNLKLTVGELKDNTLANILINGEPIPNFLPTNNTYLVEMPLGTTEDPTIEAVSNYPDLQVIEITNNGLKGKSSIRVTPPAGSPRTYRISYAITESSNSHLKGISLDGVPLAKFAPDCTNYDITLPYGTEIIPEITWIPGDAYQTITLDKGNVGETSRITVKAQNGKTTIYRLNFKVVQSSIATLSAILVDGVALPAFDPATTEYHYAVASAATSRPVVTWELGEEHQTVLKNPINESTVAIDGDTRLTVRAQDNTTMVYVIHFKQTISDNTQLAGIEVEGQELTPAFDPAELNYTCILPRGTENLPLISYTLGESTQTVRVDKNGVNGPTHLVVKAQSGKMATYTINFQVEQSTNCNLQAILIGGEPMADFVPTQLEYHYLLPSGTWELPEISVVKGDEYQKVMILKGGTNGLTQIKVVAESGAEQTYKIEFEVEKSLNANLQDILVDGVSLVGFNPEQLNYFYAVSPEATTCPVVSAVGYPGQNISISLPSLLGKAYIEVLPEEGAKNVYTIDFNYEQSHNAQLDAITLDGALIAGFTPDQLTYTIQLPWGTPSLPEIGYTVGDASQQVQVIATDLNAESYVYVMAEDGQVVTYTLDIQVEKSANALLQGIQIAGVTLPDFAPEKLSYQFALTEEMVELPELTVQSQEGQQVTISLPQLAGNAVIEVEAEDGSTKTTYTVEFAAPLHTNAQLNNILINGVGVMNFLPEQLTYTVAANYGEALPIVTYEKQDASQQVVVNNQNWKGCSLQVTAEDGTTNTYELTYEIAASQNALLADIQYYNELEQTYQSIAKFDPSTYTYDFELPWRATTLPILLPVAADNQQIITVTEGSVNGKTLIEVVAGDGTTTQTYEINFSTAKSDIATLSNIFIEGNDLPGFDPAVNQYTVTLPYGTTRIPTITYEKGLAEDGTVLYEQRVRTELSTIFHQAYLHVIAENGNENVYALQFVVEEVAKENILQAIVCGDQSVALQAGVYDYTVQLPAGTTEIPTVKVTKNYVEQRVMMDQRAMNQTSTICVKANQTGVDDIYYHILFQADAVAPAQATGITVQNGTLYPAFSPDVTQYVALVTDPNAVKVEYDAAAQTIQEAKTSNTYVATVSPAETQAPSTTYTVYLHYTNEGIPNGEFTSWSNTKYNNAQKPTYWTAPADVADKQKGFWPFSTYYTGNEVKKNGNSVAHLQTCYSVLLAGDVPGMITLGKMNLSFGVATTTTSSVEGGIPFHNTPDQLLFRYKYTEKSSHNGNIRLLYTLSDDAGQKKDVLFTDANTSQDWKESTIQLNNAPVQSPNLLNITINSASTENAKDLGGWANNTSTLYVDYVRFAYSSDIQSIDVNGVNATPSGNQFNVTVDAESQGQPQLVVNGAVADQSYDVQWYAVDEHNYQGTIQSYAEDGGSQTYNMSVFRPASANCSLAMIDVDGAPLSGFNPATLSYTYEVANGTLDMPLVTAKAGSVYQTVSVNTLERQAQIMVTAEDGSAQTYTIQFVDAQSTDASLARIEIDGVALPFVADQLEYDVELPAGSLQMPMVSYEKATYGQKVTLEEGRVPGDTRLTVVAEDGKTTQTYVLHVTVATPETAAQLASLAPVGVHDYPFDPATYTYTYKVAAHQPVQFVYAKQALTDDIDIIYKNDTLEYKVSNALTTNVYTVVLDKELSNNAQLQSILVNGVAVEGFDPLVNAYQWKGNAQPDVQAVLAEEGQSLTTVYEAETQTYQFTVLAADGLTEQVYTLQVEPILSNNADLAQIWIDGVALEGFAPEILEYDYVLAAATSKWAEPEIPVIQVQGAGENQTIQIVEKGLEAKTQILVTAENGNQKVYQIRFSTSASTNALLKGIYANTVLLDGFAPDQFDYTYPVALGEELPHLIFEKSDAYQQVVSETLNKKTTVNVTAQDGTSQVYTIQYETAYTGISTLEAINMDGQLFPGFAPDVLEYTMEFPVGTTVLPQITLVKGALDQMIQIDSKGVYGDYVITVTADNGVDQTVYTIHFSVALSSESHLADIQLDGNSLAEFGAEVYEYNCTLPVGTREWPTVTWTTGDRFQTVEKTTEVTDTWNATTYLKTLSQDGLYSQTYAIHFNVLKSDNASLNGIQYNNIAIEGFDAAQLTYTVELPIGTKEYPTVTYSLGDVYQTAVVNQEGANAQILVTAEDGSTQTYSVEFVILHSENASLNAIIIGQIPLEGFDASVLEYAYELPFGTTEMPEVLYEAGDEYQTITTQDGGINGDYLIQVSAEDGIHQQTYIIHFSVAKSDNTSLSGIFVNEVALEGFDSEIFTYQCELPYGTVAVPTITVAKGMEGQTVAIQPASDLTGETLIVVTAENGKATATYKVSFTVLPSTNPFLAMIYVNGQEVADFDSKVFDYIVSLPYGNTELPTITWKTGDPEQKVTVVMEDSLCTLSVEAEDGTPAEYTLSFYNEKCGENRLRNLYLKGKSIADFDPNNNDYLIEYEPGTDSTTLYTIEDLTFEVMHATSTVTLTQEGHVLLAQVKAQNGDIRIYVIDQVILLSDYVLLNDIKVNGETIPDFTPEQFEYTYILPFGSASVPDSITFEKGYETQTVTLSKNQIGMPTEIFVTAEDGSKNVYKIHFIVNDFDPTTVPTKDNVCILSLGEGRWRFTTNCTNVELYLTTLTGAMILHTPLELVDANCNNICDLDAEGFVYYAPSDQIVVFTFIHNKKDCVMSGKFITR